MMSFERTGDVKKGLSIGKLERIRRWFMEWAPVVKYEIRDDLSIYIEKYLYLRGSQVTNLPENLSVGWSLTLRGSHVTQLPKGLSVGGELDLEDSYVTQLPKGLSVGGSLWLANSQVTHLSEDLSVEEFIFINKNQDIEVPENLKHKVKVINN
jgi:hypothetical protein